MEIETKADPAVAASQLTPLPSGGKSQSAKKTAESFESLMVQIMLKELDKVTRINKRNFAQETQMAIFYEKVGEFVAKKGIGIKEMIMKYIDRGAKVSDGKGENSRLGGVV